jgi:hypothetical protein
MTLTWTEEVDLKGPKGDPGATGPQGPQGDTGATGPAGTAAPTIVGLGNVAAGGNIAIADPTHGALYRVTCTGATATLPPPTSPTDGDVVNLEILANVALTLTIGAGASPTNTILTGGITSPIAVAAGKVLALALRYRGAAPIGWRLLAAGADN